MEYRELSNDQKRIFIDAAQCFEAFLDQKIKLRSYAGGMRWKKSKGRDYLFHQKDRHGHGISLGRRSDETEEIYNNFHKGKKELNESLKGLKN